MEKNKKTKIEKWETGLGIYGFLAMVGVITKGASTLEGKIVLYSGLFAIAINFYLGYIVWKTKKVKKAMQPEEY